MRSSVSRNLFVIERKKGEDRGDCDTKSAKDEINPSGEQREQSGARWKGEFAAMGEKKNIFL